MSIGVLCKRMVPVGQRAGHYSKTLQRELSRASRNEKVLRCVPHRAPRITPVSTFTKLVNFGVSTRPVWWDRLPDGCRVYNSPSAVHVSAHKIRMLNALAALDIPTVPFTTDKDEAQAWLDDGRRVACRGRLTAHSGIGMTVTEPDGELPDVPLYTRLIRGQNVREFRAYVVGDEVVLMSQKRRRNGEERGGREDYVRSHRNGWVFTFNDIQLTDDADEEVRRWARLWAERHGLMFGAIDLLSNIETGRVWCVETNTAPGLRAPTVKRSMIGALT